MDLILKRTNFREDGIFSELLGDEGQNLFITLEHSYPSNMGNYFPKIPDGSYECIRGMHRLIDMDHDFETFEITGVKGHYDILFHIGNFQDDSSGCVLVGGQIKKTPTVWTIIDSRHSFDEFMELQTGVDKFTLIVTSI